MSSETANIGLVLPELSEAFDLEGHWNHNSTIIDAEIGVLKQTTAEHTQDIEGLKQTTTAQGQQIAGKQDVLTFDSTPTSGSSNPVSSGGIYADQQRQEAEIGVLANQGSKNLLRNVNPAGGTEIRTVQFTVNTDGSVDIDVGTVTGGNADLHININAETGLMVGESYVLSGCPSGGSASGYRLNISGKGADTGDGLSFTYEGGQIDVYIRISSGYVVAEPVTFRPMIRRAEITDDSFQPYAPTNRELYEMILALQSGQSVQSAPASLMQPGQLDAELADTQEVTDDA